MKKFLVFFLSIQIVFNPLVIAHSQELHDAGGSFDALSDREKQIAEQAFFDDVNNRLRFFIEVNLARISTYMSCLKKMNTSKIAFELKSECQKQIDIVYNNIQIQYPKVRRFQFLLNAFSSSTSLLWSVIKSESDFEAQMRAISFAKMKNPKADRTDYFTISHTSPFDSIFGKTLGDVEVPNNEWTNEESQAFLNDDSVNKLRGYNSYFVEICKANVVKHPQICNKIKLNYTAGMGFYFTFPADDPDIAKGIDEMWAMQQFVPVMTSSGEILSTQVVFKARETVRKFIDEIFEPGFYEIAETNAYVVLVTNASPSYKELLGAFSIMKTQAKNTLKEYEKLDARINSPSPSRDDQLSLLGYQPVVDAVLDKPLPEGYLEKFGSEKLSYHSDDEVMQIYKHVSKEYSQMMIYKLGEQLATLVALNVGLCWVGPAKLFKFIKLIKTAFIIGKLRGALTPFCYGFNFATNLWFIGTAVDDYTQIYQEIFTSIDDQSYIREMSALQTAERGILFSLIFVFAGTKDLRGLLAQKLPGLSASSREILARGIARIWSRSTRGGDIQP